MGRSRGRKITWDEAEETVGRSRGRKQPITWEEAEMEMRLYLETNHQHLEQEIKKKLEKKKLEWRGGEQNEAGIPEVSEQNG